MLGESHRILEGIQLIRDWIVSRDMALVPLIKHVLAHANRLGASVNLVCQQPIPLSLIALGSAASQVTWVLARPIHRSKVNVVRS
jgi:hypothetical protein